MQTTAIETVANSLPENKVILLTPLISKRYIPYTDLQRIFGTKHLSNLIILHTCDKPVADTYPTDFPSLASDDNKTSLYNSSDNQTYQML